VKPPKCRLCGVEHYGVDHVFSASPSRATSPSLVVSPVVKEVAVEVHAPRAETAAMPLRSSISVKHAAEELGRRGGLVGGAARAARLSPKRRSEIAKLAAAARWGKRA